MQGGVCSGVPGNRGFALGGAWSRGSALGVPSLGEVSGPGEVSAQGMWYPSMH